MKKAAVFAQRDGTDNMRRTAKSRFQRDGRGRAGRVRRAKRRAADRFVFLCKKLRQIDLAHIASNDCVVVAERIHKNSC